MIKRVLIIIAIIILIGIIAYFFLLDLLIYQRADQTVNEPIKNPAYSSNGPVVLFDEGHENFHTTEGRYKPFVQLLIADGYHVKSISNEISETNLSNADILVIANAALPLKKTEINAVIKWVKSGNGLLVISDHPPFALPIKDLCQVFGVSLSGAWTLDPARLEPDALSPTWIRYKRMNGALGNHPILEGRYPDEKINVITTFTGQSIRTETGTPLLILSDEARDYETRKKSKKAVGGVPATGHAQAVALEYGKGRVVVAGEAAMLSAQVIRIIFKIKKVGFTRPGNDNRQFALNIMHWLTRMI